MDWPGNDDSMFFSDFHFGGSKAGSVGSDLVDSPELHLKLLPIVPLGAMHQNLTPLGGGNGQCAVHAAPGFAMNCSKKNVGRTYHGALHMGIVALQQSQRTPRTDRRRWC